MLLVPNVVVKDPPTFPQDPVRDVNLPHYMALEEAAHVHENVGTGEKTGDDLDPRQYLEVRAVPVTDLHHEDPARHDRGPESEAMSGTSAMDDMELRGLETMGALQPKIGNRQRIARRMTRRLWMQK